MTNWNELDAAHVWHPFTPLIGAPEPILITEAQGVYLHTADGRKILDGISSWWVNIHGHANQKIADAISQQASTLEHVIFAGFTHKPAITLAQKVLSLLGPSYTKVFFSDNGSTAVEVALKMAIQYWRNGGRIKNRIVAIEGAYHGDTFGAMAVGDRGAFTLPFRDHLFHVDFIPLPTEENKEEVLNRLSTYFASGEVAAFVFEPLVQGAAGMRMYAADTLDEALRLAHRHHVLTIADEVFTGFGRTGKAFAFHHLKETPNIVAISKGVTGGVVPLGITACQSSILAAFHSDEVTRTFFHGHSFTANPIACAAANASFDLFTAAACQESIAMISHQHQQFAEQIRGHVATRDIRTLGTILAVELATSGATSYFNAARKNIYSYFLFRDILLRPLGNVLYFLPPYVIKEDELKRVYEAIKDFLEDYLQGKLM